jgi:tripartite-type tricarboxylate transporter receptor subunit TctC
MFRFAAFFLAFSVAALPGARADDGASFYAGKTISVLIGSTPGGGYDLYARVLAKYLMRHIPGHPTMVPQNMPGAGTLRVALYLYDVAKRWHGNWDILA